MGSDEKNWNYQPSPSQPLYPVLISNQPHPAADDSQNDEPPPYELNVSDADTMGLGGRPEGNGKDSVNADASTAAGRTSASLSPNAPEYRPKLPANRPNGAEIRESVAENRPPVPDHPPRLPGNRPNTPTNRPNPAGNRPNAPGKPPNLPGNRPQGSGKVVLDHHLEIQGENKYARAIRIYGNPLAHNETWSVTESDYTLTRLPDIDFFVKIKHKFTKIPGPLRQDRPGFHRDPAENPSFKSIGPFSPIIIANKLKTSDFAGSGFSRVFKGEVFARHDVSAADWGQFLDDIVSAGSVVPAKLPLGAGLAMTPIPMSRTIGGFIQQSKEEHVLATIDVWKERFFYPRRLNVEIDYGGSLKYDTTTSDSTDSDSEQYKETYGALRKKDSKALRKLHHRARKDRVKARRQESKAQEIKSATYGKVRLVVSPLTNF